MTEHSLGVAYPAETERICGEPAVVLAIPAVAVQQVEAVLGALGDQSQVLLLGGHHDEPFGQARHTIRLMGRLRSALSAVVAIPVEACPFTGPVTLRSDEFGVDHWECPVCGHEHLEEETP